MVGQLITREVCERARRLSQVHDEETVLMLTGLAASSYWRIKKRGWQPIERGFRLRPRPSDFAIQSRHMSAPELSAHYRASNTTITRWRRELRG